MCRLEEILEAKTEETERRMVELAAFRESLLYHRNRLVGTDPAEDCGDGSGFCGCLEAVTEEKGTLVDVESLRKRRVTRGDRGERKVRHRAGGGRPRLRLRPRRRPRARSRDQREPGDWGGVYLGTHTEPLYNAHRSGTKRAEEVA